MAYIELDQGDDTPSYFGPYESSEEARAEAQGVTAGQVTITETQPEGYVNHPSLLPK